MRKHLFIAGLLAASALCVAPADAAGLLSGVTSALGGGGSGGSSGGSGISVPGVASVSLNSQPSGTTGNATVLNGGGSTLNVGLSGLIGGNSNLGVTLPGVGGSNGTVDGLVGTVNGITGNGGTVDNLLVDTGLSGPNGGLGGAIGGDGGLLGGNGGDGNGPGGPGGPGNPGGPGGPGGYGGGNNFLWLAGNNAACQRDVRGIAPFFQARYSKRSFNSWQHAAGVQVVPVRVCAQIKAALNRAAASNASIGMLRGMAASDPLISASLSRTRHGANDVLGVGQQNGMLTVYVF